MRFIDWLEDHLGRFAVPQLSLLLIVAQAIVYSAYYVGRQGPDGAATLMDSLQLVPARVLEGEAWRLATFVAVPPFTNVVFLLFSWYLFYVMGTALERYWGTFRFNLFLLIGWLATVGVSFAMPNPERPATSGFWAGSVFLAFAFLNPYFVIHLFFLLGVQIRWLALLTWIGYGYAAIFGDWNTRLVLLASVCNFLAFFGLEIIERIRVSHRHMTGQALRFGISGRPPAFHHRCLVCGITDKTNPQMDFRYCGKCAGNCCYCGEHLKAHEHVSEAKA